MGDGHVDDFPPTLASILASPKVLFVVAHRQQGPVDSNREVRLANVIAVIKDDLRIEE